MQKSTLREEFVFVAAYTEIQLQLSLGHEFKNLAKDERESHVSGGSFYIIATP